MVTNKETKEFVEVEVTTGMEGDGGLIEIQGGLTDGEEIVIFIKK